MATEQHTPTEDELLDTYEDRVRMHHDAEAEADQLRVILKDIIRDVQEWVDAVERDSSWDGWDQQYKFFAHGGLDGYRALAALSASEKE